MQDGMGNDGGGARGGTEALPVGAAEPAAPRVGHEERVFREGDHFRDYQVIRFIGAGYSGQVYELRHRMSGERCAIKVMHLADRRNASKLERSLAEAAGTFGIQHANVIEVYDIGCEQDGMAWILMELLTGSNVSELLERQGRVSPLLALWIATEAAWGLDAAHENQIIHRDVKPENLFLTRDMEVKVIDFSVARYIPYETKTTERNVRLGTAAYMSPEYLFGEDADARLDIYALGVVLWQLLTGQHPYQHALHDRQKLLKCQLSVPLPPLGERLGLPGYVDEVLARATEKIPSRRYLSMSAFAQAMLSVAARLREDIQAGRVALDVRPGEPQLPASSRARRVYLPPVTGPEADVQGRIPSAKVVVRSPDAVQGPQGTVPVNVEEVRALVQAPWYSERQSSKPPRESEPTARRPPEAPMTAPVMPEVNPASGPRWATRTTAPVQREVRGEVEAGAAADALAAAETARPGVAPWARAAWPIAAAVVLSVAVNTLVTRWSAPQVIFVPAPAAPPTAAPPGDAPSHAPTAAPPSATEAATGAAAMASASAAPTEPAPSASASAPAGTHRRPAPAPPRPRKEPPAGIFNAPLEL